MYFHKINFLSVLFLFLFSGIACAQNEEEVLFNVNNTPVTVGEFKYI